MGWVKEKACESIIVMMMMLAVIYNTMLKCMCISLQGSLPKEKSFGSDFFFSALILLDVRFQHRLSPASWDCRLHRQHLCRMLRAAISPLTGILVWHEIIWWWGSSNAGAVGNAEYPFIAIAPRFTLTQRGSIL